MKRGNILPTLEKIQVLSREFQFRSETAPGYGFSYSNDVVYFSAYKFESLKKPDLEGVSIWLFSSEDGCSFSSVDIRFEGENG